MLQEGDNNEIPTNSRLHLEMVGKVGRLALQSGTSFLLFVLIELLETSSAGNMTAGQSHWLQLGDLLTLDALVDTAGVVHSGRLLVDDLQDLHHLFEG